MTSAPPPPPPLLPLPPISPDALATLQTLQRVLLKNGYTYVGGDADRWPDSPVILFREGVYVYMLPWRNEIAEGVIEKWRQFNSQYGDCGLLLVGDAAKTHPAVDRLFDQTRGAVAYLDAASRQFRVRRPTQIARTYP